MCIIRKNKLLQMKNLNGTKIYITKLHFGMSGHNSFVKQDS